MRKMLLVGAAPPRQTPIGGPGRGKHPLVVAIARQAKIPTGFACRYMRAENLLPEWPGSAFPLAEARREWARLLIQLGDEKRPPEYLLVAGKRAAAAIGLQGVDYLEEVVGKTTTMPAIVVPHPSEISKWWNDGANTARLRRRILRILGSLGASARCQKCKESMPPIRVNISCTRSGMPYYKFGKCRKCRKKAASLVSKAAESSRRLAKERGAELGPNPPSAAWLTARLEKQGNRCHWCSEEFKPRRTRNQYGSFERRGWDIDHVTPIEGGGIHDQKNCVLACPECNNARAVEARRPRG